jgi:hypothetical protein
MFHHWVGRITGFLSIVIGLAPVIFPKSFAGDAGLIHTQTVWWLVSAIAFLLAAKAAWEEQHDKWIAERNEKLRIEGERDVAIRDRDAKRPKLLVQVDWQNNLSNAGGSNVPENRKLTLVNDSETPAVNVNLRPLSLAGKTARFKTPSVVRKGQPVEASVDVDGFGALQRFDLHWMFDKATNTNDGLDVKATLFIDYEDSDKRQYETEQEMTYNVWTRTAEFQLNYLGPRRA